MTTTQPGSRPGILARTAEAASRRLHDLPDDDLGLSWGIKAARDLTIYGLFQVAADTVTYLQGRKAQK